MSGWDEHNSKDARLLLLKRLLDLQAWIVLIGVILLTVLVAIAVYFNARISHLERQVVEANARRSGSADVPALWIRPAPMPATQPTPAGKRAEPTAPATGPVSQPSNIDAVSELLRDLSALLKTGTDGRPMLADPNAAGFLADCLEKTLQTGEKITPALNAELSLSRVWLALNEPKKALPWAEKACQKNDPAPSSVLHLASVKAQLQDWAGALPAAQSVLQVVPSVSPQEQAEALFLIGQCYRGQRKWEQAAEALADTVAFSRAASSQPARTKGTIPSGLPAAAAIEWCETLLDLSRYDQAIAAAKTAKELGGDPQTTEALLGEALVRVGRYQDALATLQRIAAAENVSPRVLLFFGVAQLKTNDLPAAIRTFDHLLQLKPDWNLAHHWRGVAALAGNQLPQAREHLAKAVALQAGYGPSWESLGLAQLNSNQLPQAVESLQQAVELSDSSSNAGLFLALAYTRQNMNDSAKAALEQAIQKDPTVRDRARQIAPLAALLNGSTTQP